MRKVLLSSTILLLTFSVITSNAMGVVPEKEPQTVKSEYFKVDVKVRPGDSEWKQYDTRTIDTLPDFKPYSKEVKLDKFGGKIGEKFEATGFFYPKKIGDRWWLIDPDGNQFIHVAIVAVYRGLSDFGRQASAKHFGSDEKWATFSADLLKKYSFNGSGGWSEANLLRKTDNPPVYTLSWDFMSDFAVSKGLAWQVSGHMGFPDDCFPVFHPEFETWCDEYAKELIPTNKDPYLLGHFSDNELQCPKNMLDRTLKMDLEKYPEMKYNTQAAKDWLDQRKPQGWKIDNITDNDRNDYIGHVFDTYYRLTSTAIKKYDPDHLYIGSRCYGYALSCPQVFRAAGKYLGLLSCNYYRAWKPDNERMNMWTKESNLPFLITEWYAKGMDSGLPNNTGAGWTVKTQKDRAWFYNNFTLALMENKNCVGWHWFKYRDNNPEDLTTEPSNRDSNKGVVTYDYKPYVELLDEMKKLNDNVYPLIDYFDAR